MGHANAHMKRLLSAALSLAMVLQVGATAFAVGSEEGISEAPAIVLDQDGTEESPATESDSSNAEDTASDKQSAGTSDTTVEESTPANDQESSDIEASAQEQEDSADAETAANAASAVTLAGEGTAESPYQISSQADLQQLANGDADSHFVLTDNIELEGEFTPIEAFDGTLDGAGYTVSSLTVDSGVNEAALIVTNNGTIQNLGLSQVKLDGAADRGELKRASLAIYNHGTISGCYATGDLAGGWRTGGIVTENYNLIENCYFIGSVSGNWETGGIAAWCSDNRDNQIRNCYAQAVGTASTSSVGMIAGYAYAGAVFADNVALGGSVQSPGERGRVLGKEKNTPISYENNLACTEITINGEVVSDGTADNKNGADKTTDELSQQATYEEIGWDFDSVWEMNEDGRPELQGCPEAEDALERDMPDGQGTEGSPYLISDAEELEQAIAAINVGGAYAEAYYQLDANIQLKGESIPSITAFSGTLDGAGHTIESYSLSSDFETDALVRKNEGTIRNLALTDVTVTGPNTAETSRRGGLCFQNYGTIEQCYVEGSVSGGHRSGGIAAENYATIQNCYFLGDVTGRCETGGIAAWNQNTGKVLNCYVQGDITTETNNSGIIGGYGYTGTVYQGNVVMSGSTLTSANDWNHARICGRNNGDTTFIDNLSCDDVTVNGNTVADGAADNMQGLDKTAEELKQQATYTDIGWDFDTVWAMDDDLGRPVLQSCREQAPVVVPDQESYEVESPDGSIVATVYVDGEGQLGYTVTLNGVTVLERATLGLTVDGVEMGKDAALGEPVETTFDETYTTRGMHTEARNHYNQSAFPVTSGGKTMTLNVRAYDDGVAIQYDLPDGSHTVSGDDTRFAIPTDATA